MKLPWRSGSSTPGSLARLRALDGPLSRTSAMLARRAEARRKRRKRLITVNVVGLVVAVAFALVAFVFPTRALLTQRDVLDEREQELGLLQAENAKLATEIQRLQTPEEIERIARDEYGYTRPGEVAFVVLPGPPPELPGTWPYPLLAQVLQTRPA